jgi:hypothetical protein
LTDDDRSQAALGELSVSELMRQLSDQTATLVRQELELAKAELAVKESAPVSERGCSAPPACSASTPWAR